MIKWAWVPTVNYVKAYCGLSQVEIPIGTQFHLRDVMTSADGHKVYRMWRLEDQLLYAVEPYAFGEG